ncbi:MAG: hypothetical protein LUC45_05935 [Paraprevotella sp.]|nr:hypothetical protein [Paraprevotella sp.]
MDITVSKEIRDICPDFVGAALEARLINTDFSAPLWNEIETFRADYIQKYTKDSLKTMPAIQATRQVYKRCGKDPSRYRPSSEALIRRMLLGHDLYKINTAVDLINLASIAYGYSIGGFDVDKIEGHELVLGIGKPGEPYIGIGRGPLNIEGLPVYRDRKGGIGTPTSDHERTKLSTETTRLLALVNGYDGNEKQVEACAMYMQALLRRYAGSDGGSIHIYK